VDVSNPYQVVKDFEADLCAYTGARYAVAVNSCSMAILLAVAWHTSGNHGISVDETIRNDAGMSIEIPRRTYVSVPMSIIHAGGIPTFRDENWRGQYQLKPLPVWDCARWFTGGMYECESLSHAGQMQCVSFHASKILGDTQGGAILHDNPDADAWLRRARFDGRTEGVAPKNDRFTHIGWHCYMSADVAARLRLKLYSLPAQNDPLPNDDYPDLSAMGIFR
jgi:dTDP-4-amino-4,6-dideoxygalactose transaminase